MTSRFRFVLIVGTLAVAGCNDAFNAGPLRYVENAQVASDLESPKLRQVVRDALAAEFGADPQRIRVPAGSGLPYGGARLANYVQFPDKSQKRIKLPVVTDPGQPATPELVRGGYALYREHCLHCHGVSGAGDGPTAPFLYPRPRDYRPGKFKFTSTPNGHKPTRADLKKTILHGLHGTSMPAFESLMTDFEVEQVTDYVIFLSARGETELRLIEDAKVVDPDDEEGVKELREGVENHARNIFEGWKNAQNEALNPPIPRPPATRASVLRGRALFLGHPNKAGKTVDCKGCHGVTAVGDGNNFVPQEVFNDVVFGGDPSTRDQRLAVWLKGDPKLETLWTQGSLDEWGQPLRPANLNRGVYKGGRRPIDIYWRIANGITGAKMPSHSDTLTPEDIWDVVNFVLTLPYEPDLLRDAARLAAPAAKAPTVAGR